MNHVFLLTLLVGLSLCASHALKISTIPYVSHNLLTAYSQVFIRTYSKLYLLLPRYGIYV